MSTAVSLFWIAVCAVAAPLIAGLVPRKLLPEVVLLLGFGVLIGPHGIQLATATEGVEVLSDLGLAMLFLLAGYEINLKELTGRGGRRALVTWLICIAIAGGLVYLLGTFEAINAEAAIAIVLTSTALGTLLPILKEQGLVHTRFGRAILNHGAVGELSPVLAMALLLGTRGALGSILALVIFALAAVVVALVSVRVGPPAGLRRLIMSGSETTSQTTVRLVALLLVSFSALAVVFDLDLVLGAFAAGFILRRIVPHGDLSLDQKLEAIGFGLVIPIFFITSGMAIDPRALVDKPLVLLAFVVSILLIRGIPILIASWLDREPTTGRRVFSNRESVGIALYGATGLPIIVAVTSVAVAHGQMSNENASLLVAGGAITVLLLPMTATLIIRGRPDLVRAEAAPLP